MTDLLFGIDFGTTYSTVAVHDGDRARVLNHGGEWLVPSAVYYPRGGAPVVGSRAIERSVFEPDRTITNIKRLLGRGFDTKLVQDFLTTVPYRVEADEERSCVVNIDTLRLTPGDVATSVFSELRQLAVAETDSAFVSAVVTAPAHFGAAQKRAIHHAAARAGIDVVRVLTEPTAASVAYGAKAKADERVMIFDMGGGTLDVTVLMVTEDAHQILAVGGHPMLGGIDCDQAICGELEHQILLQTGQNVREDPVAFRRLLYEAERIKISLSEVDQVDTTLPQLFAGTDVRLRYNRRAFEGVITAMVDRAVEISQQVVKDAGLHQQEIDKLLLVGGSTRIPCVQQRLEQAYGFKPSKALHPQEAVALGAATFGRTLGASGAVRVLDVLPASVGYGDPSRRMVPVLARNTTLPCEASFEVDFDPAEATELTIFQGDQEYIDDNEAIGLLQLELGGADLLSALITLRADMAGIVTVSAFDRAGGQVVQTKLNMNVRQRISSWAR